MEVSLYVICLRLAYSASNHLHHPASQYPVSALLISPWQLLDHIEDFDQIRYTVNEACIELMQLNIRNMVF